MYMYEIVDFYECSYCKLKFYSDSYWVKKGDPKECPECNCEDITYKCHAIIYSN